MSQRFSLGNRKQRALLNGKKRNRESQFSRSSFGLSRRFESWRNDTASGATKSFPEGLAVAIFRQTGDGKNEVACHRFQRKWGDLVPFTFCALRRNQCFTNFATVVLETGVPTH